MISHILQSCDVKITKSDVLKGFKEKIDFFEECFFYTFLLVKLLINQDMMKKNLKNRLSILCICTFFLYVKEDFRQS